MVNERIGGGYYLTVFNNSGVNRTVADGESIEPDSDITVTLSFKGESAPMLCDGDAKLCLEDGIYRLNVPGGGWCIIKF